MLGMLGGGAACRASEAIASASGMRSTRVTAWLAASSARALAR